MFVRKEKEQILQEQKDDIEKYFTVTIKISAMAEAGKNVYFF